MTPEKCKSLREQAMSILDQDGPLPVLGMGNARLMAAAFLAADDERARLETQAWVQRDAWAEMLKDVKEREKAATVRAEQAEAERARLRKALRENWRHVLPCTGWGTCHCGLDATLQQSEPEVHTTGVVIVHAEFDDEEARMDG